jgi:ATP-binding cassette subfamily G (WHITE) protein 2 (PDR)
MCVSPYADPGARFVNGTKYLELAYNFRHDQLWRSYWVLLLFMGVLCAAHVVSSEFILAEKSKGEVLVFLRGRKPQKAVFKSDEEAQSVPEVPRYFVEGPKLINVDGVEEVLWSKSSFCWQDLSYEITVNKQSKTLLTGISGWVRPGTLTALMGATGAGKTTLLDVLSQRASTGIISGKTCLNDRDHGDDFQGKTGYAQQADVHLPTSTVREALQFAALLRQPSHIPESERIAHVEEVIEVLEMDSFADALVGVPGQGLYVEQRKRLTVGVELAAKPEQLLFLDEPTSGLDIQGAWTIFTLLKKLASRGLA